MRFHPTTLDHAWLVHLEPVLDRRGFFARTFCVEEFAAHGLETSYAQHSISFSARRGTLRGMHYQREPHSEVKLVRCVEGSNLGRHHRHQARFTDLSPVAEFRAFERERPSTIHSERVRPWFPNAQR